MKSRLLLFCLATILSFLLPACQTTNGNSGKQTSANSTLYNLTGAQINAIKQVAKAKIHSSVRGAGPLELRKLKARSTNISGKEIIEVCGFIYDGKKTVIGRDIQQCFYGSFPSKSSTGFSIELPPTGTGRSDLHLGNLFAKCAARGLGSGW